MHSPHTHRMLHLGGEPRRPWGCRGHLHTIADASPGLHIRPGRWWAGVGKRAMTPQPISDPHKCGISIRELLPESWCRELLPEHKCKISIRELLPESWCRELLLAQKCRISIRELLPESSQQIKTHQEEHLTPMQATQRSAMCGTTSSR